MNKFAFPKPKMYDEDEFALSELLVDRFGYGKCNVLMVFDVKDYKDRVYRIFALQLKNMVAYVKSIHTGHQLISKPIFKALLMDKNIKWIYVGADAENKVYGDLLIEVI
jgi:hypothetical protein